MIENVSISVIIGFILTTVAVVWLFYKAVNSWKILPFLAGYMIIVAVLGYSGFYRDIEATPSRFIFLLPLGLLFVLIYSISPHGKRLIHNANINWLTLIHTLRVPIEIVLYKVYLAGLIPSLMTFEGYNWDILSGVSAPLIFYFFIKRKINKPILLWWNIICLLLLVNVVTIALLSAQTPLQQLALNQPNIGVTYFPFVWLPAVIVPIILFSHIASIKQLLIKKRGLGKGID